MTKLLVNGCSFANSWSNADELGQRLNCSTTVNLGLPGGSNSRSLRTTAEYLTQNTDVSFVIIMLTVWDRQEAPWGKENDPYNKTWVSYAANGITNRMLSQIDKSEVELKLIDRYIVDKFKYDFDNAYMDKWLMDIITFSAWLDSLKIDYCIFNTCERRYQNFEDKKFQLIAKNNKIIDIKNFLSNIYIYDQGATCPQHELDNFKKQKIELDPAFIHWDSEGGKILNDFLYDYIVKNCLNT
jgi:hypothetical protein